MKISIALATYNGENYLQEQLDSILLQSMLPDEFVISDDNSNDRTEEILEEFKSKASFNVVLLKNSSIGFNSNFENALRNTTGDIIFICDQDDVWMNNKIEKSLEFLSIHPEFQVIIHDLEYCDSKLFPIGETKIERFKKNNKSLVDYVTGMATTVRRDFLDFCFPFSQTTNYDTWIHSCANLLNIKGVNNEVLAKYRRHDNNATKSCRLNNINKANLIDVIKIKLKYNHKVASQNEILLYKDLLNHFERTNTSKFFFGVDYTKIKNHLDRKIYLSQYRINLLSRNFLIRFVMAINFYLKGGYANYSGIGSMIKDILGLQQK